MLHSKTRRLALAAAIALLHVPLLAGSGSATATETLDAHFDEGEVAGDFKACPGNGAGGTFNAYAAYETFVAESTGTLSRVEVTAYATSSFSVSIHSFIPGVGIGPQIGVNGVVPAGTTGWTSSDVSAEVTEGTAYALRFTPRDACVSLPFAIDDQYPGGTGELQIYDFLLVMTGADFFFRTYVTSDPVEYTVSAFSQPIDNDVTNRANAGRALPFKFRVTDHTGAAVTDLNGADVSVAADLNPCIGSGGDVVESYAAGSGLSNLGNGYYEYAFKTQKSWANKCGSLTLTTPMGGARAAEFVFK